MHKSTFLHQTLILSGLLFLFSVPPVRGAMDARFELEPSALGVSASPKRNVVKERQPSRHRTAVKHDREEAVYTIKSGDNLFKILMRDYGLRNEEAESLIDVICRENNISDIRNLKVGQKIVIPSSRTRVADGNKGIKPSERSSDKPATGGQLFRLASPEAALSELEASVQVRQAWNKLIPQVAADQKPIVIQSPSFSLTLDPQRYPVYATMDNGRILVDRNASIPPLVKALISEKDPSIRIVSESPRNGKPFLSAMLSAAGFYSVEENFTMEYGTDPRLTVHSDFKIEKSSESVIKQDLVLMNAGTSPFPGALTDFLKKEGFTVHEPFASRKAGGSAIRGALHQITSRKQSDIVDALLSSLSVVPDKDRRLDVFAADNNGISLSVKAERYFERGGKPYVITSFDGDPVLYTLYRILETKGYQVTILDPKDDFRKVSEKLISRLGIPGTYAQHSVGPDASGNYTLRMSGFKLDVPEYPAGSVFLTNLELDRVVRDLLAENGYKIINK